MKIMGFVQVQCSAHGQLLVPTRPCETRKPHHWASRVLNQDGWGGDWLLALGLGVGTENMTRVAGALTLSKSLSGFRAGLFVLCYLYMYTYV